MFARAARQSLRQTGTRCSSSGLSPQQTEELAGNEIKFPLYVYLRDLRQEQSNMFSELRKDQQNMAAEFRKDQQNMAAEFRKEFTEIHKEQKAMGRDIAKLGSQVSRLPLIVLGAAAAGVGLVQGLGSKDGFKLDSINT